LITRFHHNPLFHRRGDRPDPRGGQFSGILASVDADAGHRLELGWPYLFAAVGRQCRLARRSEALTATFKP